MKVKNSFVLRCVAGINVVTCVDSLCDFDGMISLNETAAFMWEKLEQGTTEEELTNALCAEYDVDAQTASKDVANFIQQLNEHGILE